LTFGSSSWETTRFGSLACPTDLVAPLPLGEHGVVACAHRASKADVLMGVAAALQCRCCLDENEGQSREPFDASVADESVADLVDAGLWEEVLPDTADAAAIAFGAPPQSKLVGELREVPAKHSHLGGRGKQLQLEFRVGVSLDVGVKVQKLGQPSAALVVWRVDPDGHLARKADGKPGVCPGDTIVQVHGKGGTPEVLMRRLMSFRTFGGKPRTAGGAVGGGGGGIGGPVLRGAFEGLASRRSARGPEPAEPPAEAPSLPPLAPSPPSPFPAEGAAEGAGEKSEGLVAPDEGLVARGAADLGLAVVEEGAGAGGTADDETSASGSEAGECPLPVGALLTLVVWPRAQAFNILLKRTGPHWRRLGLSLALREDRRCILIVEVHETGLVAEWNARNGQTCLCSGDRILAVNEVSGDPFRMYSLVLATSLGGALRLQVEPPPRSTVPKLEAFARTAQGLETL